MEMKTAQLDTHGQAIILELVVALFCINVTGEKGGKSGLLIP